MSASTTYLKSALAGIVAVVLALVLIPVVLLLVGVAYFTIAKAPQTSETIGWDPVSFLHQIPVIGLLPGWSPLIVLALLFFAAGFYWQFRRDSRKVAIRGHLR